MNNRLLTDEEIRNICNKIQPIMHESLREEAVAIAQDAKTLSTLQAPEELREKIKRFLEDWVTAYKDAAERNALAEDPDESAEYLTDQITPLFEAAKQKAVEKERKRIGKEIISIFNFKETDWGDIYSLGKALQGE